jgi:lipopolysaccharide assembly protein A
LSKAKFKLQLPWIGDTMKDLMQSMKVYLWWVFVFFLLSFLITFVFQNSSSIALKFLVWNSPPLPLPYFIFGAFATGIFFAGAVGLIENFKLNARIRKMRRMTELLEREVDALRNQPLFDEPPVPPSAPPADDA